MYKKNELKNLIYIQDNKPCSEQTVKGLFRSIVEPILENNSEGLILLRLEEKSKNDFTSLLKRLEYSNAKVYDFSDVAISEKIENILKEKRWGNTEFVYVLAERFSAVLIFDYTECEIENFAQFYIFHNSKKISEVFELINSNSTVDLSSYDEMWHPDRRDNLILNNSIRKIVECFNDTNQEMIISQMEQETSVEERDLAAEVEFLQAKSSYIAHEMRNLMSICSLYSEIIRKHEINVDFGDEETKNSILNSRDCIRRSMIMAGNLLLDFKSLKKTKLVEYDLKELLDNALELSQVYAIGRNINFVNRNNLAVPVLVDENKFTTVMINLIKNAVESFEREVESGGKIALDTEMDNNSVRITLSNNGNPISKEFQSKIFTQGFTTKTAGSGLGLAICKRTLEEQHAELRLIKSDDVSTEFEIKVLRGDSRK